jgi:hypothetical protein
MKYLVTIDIFQYGVDEEPDWFTEHKTEEGPIHNDVKRKFCCFYRWVIESGEYVMNMDGRIIILSQDQYKHQVKNWTKI